MQRIEYLMRLSKGNEHMCANCKHYYEHYVRGSFRMSSTGYTEIDEGHCTYPRLKMKKAWNTCEHWESKDE